MKKNKILAVLIVLLIIFSLNVGTIFAATGERLTPYRAWNNHRLIFQEDSFYSPKTVELQLKEFYRGSTASQIIASEDEYYTSPKSDEEWLLMKFNLKYISDGGKDEELLANDMISSDYNFYSSSYALIKPIESAYFDNERAGLDEYDVSLYPGVSSTVWYEILVKKTVGYLVIKVATGINKVIYDTNYSWFATNPNYVETLTAPSNVKAISAGYNSIRTSWSSVSGASGYEIYRSTSSGG